MILSRILNLVCFSLFVMGALSSASPKQGAHPYGHDTATYAWEHLGDFMTKIDPRLTRSGDAACDARIGNLISDVAYYDYLSWRGYSKNVKKLMPEIVTLLSASQSAEDPCLASLLRAYTVASTLLPILEHFEKTDPSWLWITDTLGKYQPRYGSLPLTTLVLALDRLGMIHYLTPNVRKNWGGVWNQFNRKHTGPLVLGTYDCQSGAIFVDPLQSPYDLRAILLHELDHWARDKYTPDLGLPIRQALLIDEALATLAASASHLELRLAQTPISRQRTLLQSVTQFLIPGTERRIEPDKYHTSSYAVSGDIDFFNPQGPLHAVAEDFEQSLQQARKLDPDHQDGFSFFGLFQYGMKEFRTKYEHNWESVFDTVRSNYFKNPNQDLVLAIDSVRSHFTQVLPLAEYLYNPKAVAPMGPLARWVGPRSFEDEYPARAVGEALALDPVFSELARQPTLTCARFEQAVLGPDLSDYLGSGAQPIALGNEGGRPGNEGGRPGNEGGRPGNEGGRPGITLQPCLSDALDL